MNMDLLRALETFFQGLSLGDEGRLLLCRRPGAFHVVAGTVALTIIPTAGGVRVDPAEPTAQPSPDVTRLAVSSEDVLWSFLNGSASFTEAVIPLNEDVGSVLFVDNWMSKKSQIAWLGSAIRVAQQQRGFCRQLPEHPEG